MHEKGPIKPRTLLLAATPIYTVSNSHFNREKIKNYPTSFFNPRPLTHDLRPLASSTIKWSIQLSLAMLMLKRINDRTFRGCMYSIEQE